ncbi:MAG: hypothetical protein WCX74_02330 [Candidatus Paceibacterota bacterium]
MIDLQDKRIYTYGGFILALVLLALTVFSFFQKPKYEPLGKDNSGQKVIEEVNTAENASLKSYPRPDISTSLDVSGKNNYSTKIFRLTGLPESVQAVVYADIEKKKTSFINKYKNGSIVVSLEGESPTIYQSEQYVSIVMYFSEYASGELVKKTLLCWTYDSEAGKIVSLPQVFESENKNNEVFKYLVTSLRQSIVGVIVDKLALGIDAGGYRTEIDANVGNVLTAEEKNFSNWYLKDGWAFFIFDPIVFVTYSLDDIEVSINVEASKLYLKNHAK